MARVASVGSYYLLGRSGLRVSPLCLGTMTFGTEWGWGSPKETAFALMDKYVEGGGNFIDTADLYTNGTSEQIIGEYIKQRGNRDNIVLATKFTFQAPGSKDPNSYGNGRKNIYRALEGSLKRLQTDYIDLYWLHAWDCLTPVDEVVSTLSELVRHGKIRYYGFSDVPAWYATRAETIAEMRSLERPVGLQLEYSLIERNIEREHVPVAEQFGMGICSWSPLCGGILTGKYRREGGKIVGEGRVPTVIASGHPAFEKLSEERNWAIVDEVTLAAKRLERSPAQIALNWITKRPGVASTIIGATKLDQLEDNLRSLELEIPPEVSSRLEAVSRPATTHPYSFFEPKMRAMIAGGASVRERPPWWR